MHQAVTDFVFKIKQKYPNNFCNCKVIECGSLDINGSTRNNFYGCDYQGVDLGPGKGVDIIGKFHEVPLYTDSYDTVISTECFEHNAEWRQTFLRMIEVCKPNGLIIFTCATTGRAIHGHADADPASSPFTNNYYMNLTQWDFEQICIFDEVFKYWEFNVLGTDLQFFGIKK